MNIVRWDPWGQIVGLREAMDSLLEQSFVRPRTEGSGTSGAFALAVDVEDRGDAFVVETSVPGVRPEDVEISVIGDTLRIHAERREEHKEGGDGGRPLVREQRFGVFERVLRLPAPVEAGGAQADFQDGVLRITLPKAEGSKERRIPVRAGAEQGNQDQPQAMEAGTGQSQQDGQQQQPA